MGAYSYRAIISGDIVEIYTYDKVIPYGYTDTKRKGKKGRSAEASFEDKKINRSKVTNRARTDLTRLINTNYEKGSSRFITLTFRENMQDLKKANYEFKKFVQRFEYYLKYKLKYSVVVEFQKRGAIHYHTIFYNIPNKLDLPKCAEIWGQGSFNCKRIDRVKNVGAYMVKYMNKNSDDERLVGQKMYFNSRNLKKPIEIKEPVSVIALVGSLQKQAPIYENEYDIEYSDSIQNHVIYKQYNIRDDFNLVE
ncbi:MAG: hypothetical protein E6096_16250 [Clostridium sp.]|uniref:Replication-associated protein ORF2/G2P domain-containing protein n=4 Tax=Clostridium perfringens TaxID=1502 RepID=A0AAW9KD28_CLOPF|nr:MULTISPECIES: hypothetical protein [Clostridium]MDK0672354.1 hypothetical protein [Clostridium perfringens]MDK0761199.1 hypothetical protein [Clostridium perfringens]MDK0764153.1 hypothetical protein [Clostridium perfringens]MDU5448049.1 hypothetical protein [Clostridium sp.]MDU7111987.1 hypothetical protein [Clostridium perfringens]